MDVNEIVQAITTLGFPIVACAALFWQNTKLTQAVQDAQARTCVALENNTQALNDLKATLSSK